MPTTGDAIKEHDAVTGARLNPRNVNRPKKSAPGEACRYRDATSWDIERTGEIVLNLVRFRCPGIKELG